MAATASSGSPAPAAAPTAAVTQTDAAVVRPCTESRRTKISPAPRNPMPVTIWAATRDGSTTTWPVRSTSLNPYLLTSMNRAAPTPTRVCVRSPALFCLTSRSSPMTADSSRPRPSSPTCTGPSVLAAGAAAS